MKIFSGEAWYRLGEYLAESSPSAVRSPPATQGAKSRKVPVLAGEQRKGETRSLIRLAVLPDDVQESGVDALSLNQDQQEDYIVPKVDVALKQCVANV